MNKKIAVIGLAGRTELGEGARVENLIVADENLSIDDMQAQYSDVVLLDAGPLGLGIGDTMLGGRWVRYVDGAPVVLPITTPNAQVEDVLAILRGEDVAGAMTEEQRATLIAYRDALQVAQGIVSTLSVPVKQTPEV